MRRPRKRYAALALFEAAGVRSAAQTKPISVAIRKRARHRAAFQKPAD